MPRALDLFEVESSARRSSHHVGLFMAALCGVASVALADGEFTPQFKPTLEVRATRNVIDIDGELDDAGWLDAARATGFAEVDPGDQVAPPVESEAWVTYDDEYLYFALIAHDDPSAIRVTMSDRDAIFQDDYFGIMLDTYGDLTWGYEFFVNPIGIQGDLRMVSGSGEDDSFDVVWHSEGKITEDGYQVEIAIPFSSLRFPNREEQRWRINFWRDHQRDLRRRYAWAAQDRDDPCFICQWGHLEGVKGIEPGRNVDVIASAVGSQFGQLSDRSDPGSRFDNETADGHLSLNARYGVTSSASAELAVNPDFSQIESDERQIDVNTTFGLFFPERRPFFQEGSDLYNMWINAIYTRSVNDPDAAAKLTGTFGRSSVYYLLARDNTSPITLPGEERSFFLQGEKSITNLLRARQTFGEDSYVGVTVTDRRFEADDGPSGTVGGVDARIRFTRNLQLEAQGMLSRTAEPSAPDATSFSSDDTFNEGRHTYAFDAETYTGAAAYVSLERSARRWNSDFDYWEFGPNFRTDNGFTTQNNYRQLSLWNGVSFRPNRRGLVSWEPSIGFGRIWRSSDGRFEDEWIRPNLWFQFPGQTSFSVQHLISRERFAERITPNIRIWTISADTRPVGWLSFGGHLNFGKGIRRSFSNPVLANQFNAGLFARINIAARLVVEPNWNYQRQDSRTDDTNFFAGSTLRTRVNYQFTRRFFARVIVQYDTFADQLDVEPLLTYRVNPFTVFFLGSTGNYQYFDAGDSPTDSIEDSSWKLADRQLFAKVQYLFRL